MYFNSLTFIFIFLPAVLAGYYGIGKRSTAGARLWLTGASFFFIGEANARVLLLLVLSMAVNYVLSLFFQKPWKRAAFVPAVFFNIGLLLYFKYTDFFLANCNSAFGTNVPLLHLALPLGISFYTFTLLSYDVETYRGALGRLSLPDYCLYVSYFPKFTQGPIMRPGDFAAELDRNRRIRWDYDAFVRGAQMFTCGLCKKVLLADTFAKPVDYYFQYYRNCTTLDLAIATLAYTFQIYFDFSGYCDMASGISEMLGFRLPVNFNSPYRAWSVTEFWKRWHITLTDFLREYVYFPLGGSRRGRIRTCVNILIVFLVSGFWHGANWTFLYWGMMHGVLMVFERLFRRPLSYIPKAVRWFPTFAFINLGWLCFRSESVAQFEYINTQWGYLNMALNRDLVEGMRIPGLRAVLQLAGIPYSDLAVYKLSTLLWFAAAFFVCLCLPNNQKRRYQTTRASLTLTAAMLIVSVISLGSVSTFIYSNF